MEAQKEKIFGSIFFVTFSNSMPPNQRQAIINSVEFYGGIYVNAPSGRVQNIFVPKGIKTTIKEILNHDKSNIVEFALEDTPNNRLFIKNCIAKYIVNKFNEIKDMKDAVLTYGSHAAKGRNLAKEYQELITKAKEWSEEYAINVEHLSQAASVGIKQLQDSFK